LHFDLFKSYIIFAIILNSNYKIDFKRKLSGNILIKRSPLELWIQESAIWLRQLIFYSINSGGVKRE